MDLMIFGTATHSDISDFIHLKTLKNRMTIEVSVQRVCLLTEEF